MRVLFFAQLKEAAGCDSVDIPVSKPMDSSCLWTELENKFPALAGHRRCVRLARNQEYAGPETVFTNADEVALIPPVSGG